MAQISEFKEKDNPTEVNMNEIQINGQEPIVSRINYGTASFFEYILSWDNDDKRYRYVPKRYRDEADVYVEVFDKNTGDHLNDWDKLEEKPFNDGGTIENIIEALRYIERKTS